MESLTVRVLSISISTHSQSAFCGALAHETIKTNAIQQITRFIYDMAVLKAVLQIYKKIETSIATRRYDYSFSCCK